MFKRERPAVDAVVVGLGNYGEKYKNTRHNAGFMAIDYIVDDLSLGKSKSRWQGTVWQAQIAGKRVLLVEPHTYMNRSGDCVAKIVSYLKLSPENVLVLYDDTALDTGALRIRKRGSDGGHNGIKSIIYQLNSDAFPRVKIGVGKKPSPDYDLADYVLGTYSDADKKALFSMFSRVYDGVELILSGQIDKAMNLYNR